jgi:hypothetical protein
MVAAEAIIVAIEARRNNWCPLAGSPKWVGPRDIRSFCTTATWMLGSVNTAVVQQGLSCTCNNYITFQCACHIHVLLKVILYPVQLIFTARAFCFYDTSNS